jgi:hypothetical protein
LDSIAVTEDRRQPRAERRLDNARAVGVNERSAHNVKRVRFGLERLEGGRNILCPPDFKRRDFDPERASPGLSLGQLQRRNRVKT